MCVLYYLDFGVEHQTLVGIQETRLCCWELTQIEVNSKASSQTGCLIFLGGREKPWPWGCMWPKTLLKPVWTSSQHSPATILLQGAENYAAGVCCLSVNGSLVQHIVHTICIPIVSFLFAVPIVSTAVTSE